MATQWLLGLENRQIIKAATGLGGGVGHEGDTCGALTGGILSLGLYHCNNECDQLYPDCIEYYNRFKRRLGSSKCRDILNVKFKVGYDIRHLFLKGIRCLKVVYTSIASVFDIIQKCNRKLTSENIYQIRPPFNTQRFFCADLVLSRIESKLHSDIGSILEITRGFSGGIAMQGDICGALMGGILALGTVFGTELREKQHSRLFRAGIVAMKEGCRVFQNENLHPSFKTSLHAGTLYNKFLSQFGSVDCIDILSRISRSQKRNFCEKLADSTAQFTLDCIHAHNNSSKLRESCKY